MIAYLRGVCQTVEDDGIVVDVHGVGYFVHLADRDRGRYQPGVDAELLVHTEVREDALLLYGFATPAGRQIFRILLSVSGLGPKGAMALLSTLSPEEIALAVRDEQVGVLTRARGIGKKLAEVIVVKLRDRLPPELLLPRTGEAPRPTAPAPAALDRDVLSALANLGYKPAAAEAALQQAKQSAQANDFNGLMRATLALLRRPG